MNWNERLSSKMNRSSWKTAHDDQYPDIENMIDPKEHLMSHHQGDLINDFDDHEWFHIDPDAYNSFHKENGRSTRNNQPDHYHSNNPNLFLGSKTAHNDYHPWPNTEEQALNHLLNTGHHEQQIVKMAKELGFPTEVWRQIMANPLNDDSNMHRDMHQRMHFDQDMIKDIGKPDHEHDDDNDIKINVPENIEEISPVYVTSSWKTAHEGDHPQIEDMDDLQAHLVSHHQGDFIGDEEDHERFHCDPTDYLIRTKHMGYPVNLHNPDHWHTNDYEQLNVPNSLPQSFASFKKKSDPSTLRGEGIPAFTEPSYQDDQDEDDQVVGPQDLDSNATTVDKFPKSVGVFKNSFSEFGQPMNDGANRMQSLEDTSRLQVRYPLDTGKRDYAEQREDANPIPLRSWYTGDDVNGPWPHSKNLSGPLDFEPTDDQNKDSTGPVMSSFQSRYSHMHNVNHPWPGSASELEEHLLSHHQNLLDSMNREVNVPPEHWDDISKQTIRRAPDVAFNAHQLVHKTPDLRNSKYFGPEDHEHDDDDLGIDIPKNIEEISPTYVTSSWHEAFVETFDTNPDEDNPDTLLNPADELKNGRPRANDLPNQSAQLIPGMLIDHDQMGGSGTSSAGF